MLPATTPVAVRAGQRYTYMVKDNHQNRKEQNH